jgi:hypothetical protein
VRRGVVAVSAPLATGQPSRKGVVQSFAVQRSLVDGTLRSQQSRFPQMSDDHWDFLVLLGSCTRGEDSFVWAGTPSAVEYVGFDFAAHGVIPRSREAHDLLYGPLLKYGFVASCGTAMKNGAWVHKYRVLAVPEVLPHGRITVGQPFTKTSLRLDSVPFVMLPSALVRQYWRALGHADRRCMSALYSFMTPDATAVDPNHLRWHCGGLVVSPAVLRATGCGADRLGRMLGSLESRGLLTTPEVSLSSVAVFPGSRPRLILDEAGSIPCAVVRPALPAPAKRPRARRAS